MLLAELWHIIINLKFVNKLFVMKKVLLGSIVLTMFSVAIILFQLSCRKTADAQTPTAVQVLNKTLLFKGVSVQVGTKTSTTTDSTGQTHTIITPVYKVFTDFYLLDNTTSNIVKINITPPQGQALIASGALSPDGKKLVFATMNSIDPNGQGGIYSCLIDGSNVTKLVDGNYALLGTY
jgi:hypothetical protein